MTINPNKIVDLVNKTFSIKQNAFWKAKDFAKLVIEAASHNTYLETVKTETMPSADNFHYRIQEDTNIEFLNAVFQKLTGKQLRKLKNKRVTVIMDYTYEPFFGNIEKSDIWVHRYRPANGCSGCYKIFSVSILLDDERFFVYAVPASVFFKEAEEIEFAIEYLQFLGVKSRMVLLDRGFARDSKNLKVLNKCRMKFLGLYQKYTNVKKIINETKRQFINREFSVRGIKTRLVIGKKIGKKKITWVFVTNLEYKDFFRYLRLYKKRWNIETGFRVQDEAHVKSKSNVLVRFYLFLVAMLLYNIWKLLKIAIPFKRFVIELENSCGVVNEIREIKPG